MHYFTKQEHGLVLTAIAETDAAHARLIARGYVECKPEEHRAAWAARDRERRLELAVEEKAAQPLRDQTPLGRITRPGVVYPSSWKH